MLKPFPKILDLYLRVTMKYAEFSLITVPLTIYNFKSKLSLKPRKTILFYPDVPEFIQVLKQLCQFNAYKISYDLKDAEKADAVIFFTDSTFREPDEKLKNIGKNRQIINFNSRDISKERVDRIQEKVFGYGLTINPETFKGKYVKKGNINAMHNGVILDKPEKASKEYVYQHVVNNVINDLVVDIRVPVFKDTIPFVYLKYRPLLTRFESDNVKSRVTKVEEVLSKEECEKIIQLCREMEIDHGELDILRDKDTKKLYVVDVNNTPGGPPFGLTRREYKNALQNMSNSFINAFLSDSKSE